MKTAFHKLLLVSALGLLCAAHPSTHAAMYIKYEGIKLHDATGASPEVWRWFVTPLDGTGAGGVNVAVGDVTGDGMDPVTVALLLPAVQKVREAAAQWPGTIPSELTSPLSEEETALLLPAVQKVREAGAALPSPGTASLLDFTTDLDPVTLQLLLPAVQKVREAALPLAPGMPPVTDHWLLSLLVPATYQADLAADRVAWANQALPTLLGLPGAGDPGLTFSSVWQLNAGQVTLGIDSAPVTAVPEPSTWALWMGALGAAALLRTRRRPEVAASPG